MEEVIVSKMQAVELAKAIVEARDAELAFLWQVQEIVKSTTNVRDSDGEELEDPSQVQLTEDSSIAGDKDKAAALELSIDELCGLVDETEETQLSLLEAARLAQLDTIREHDARFARSLVDMPDNEWDSVGHSMDDPYKAPLVPRAPLANEVDEYELVMSLLEDASNHAVRKPPVGAGMRGHRHTMQHARLLASPLTIHETAPRRWRSVHRYDKNAKGKGKLVMQDEEAKSLMVMQDEEAKSLIAGLIQEHEHMGSETESMDAGKHDLNCCQICFDATLTTTTFVTLEGCEHQFCETCVSRHAEARILDGRQMHVTCLHAECPTIIPQTQLSSLLSSALLEILTRRQVEAAIPETERVYCPFRDCSAMLIKPTFHIDNPSSSAHPHPTAFGCVECEFCHRAFCMECAVAWHADMSCAEFKANEKNVLLLGDKKLLQLAGKKKWQRCKQCGRFVELSAGCSHMTCWCGFQFCYICGDKWVGGTRPCKCSGWK